MQISNSNNNERLLAILKPLDDELARYRTTLERSKRQLDIAAQRLEDYRQQVLGGEDVRTKERKVSS